MKQINPLKLWINGVFISAVQFFLHVNFDNLETSATFYYSLNDADGNKLVDGNITMTGADYDAYSTNQDAWDWGAENLGLTFSETK